MAKNGSDELISEEGKKLKNTFEDISRTIEGFSESIKTSEDFDLQQDNVRKTIGEAQKAVDDFEGYLESSDKIRDDQVQKSVGLQSDINKIFEAAQNTVSNVNSFSKSIKNLVGVDLPNLNDSNRRFDQPEVEDTGVKVKNEVSRSRYKSNDLLNAAQDIAKNLNDLNASLQATVTTGVESPSLTQSDLNLNIDDLSNKVSNEKKLYQRDNEEMEHIPEEELILDDKQEGLSLFAQEAMKLNESIATDKAEQLNDFELAIDVNNPATILKMEELMIDSGNFTQEEVNNIKDKELNKNTQVFQKEFEAIKELEEQQRLHQGKGKADEEEKDINSEEEALDTKSVKLAQDSIIFNDEPEAVNSLSQSQIESDPITKAVREAILGKQNKILQDSIAESLQDEQKKEQISSMDPAAFRQYLATDEGKEAVSVQLKDVEIQKSLNEIEVTSYKKIHEDFKESFKDVKWEKNESQPNVKTSQVKNSAGEVVIDIKELTHDKQVQLGDGTTKTVSCRSIDFPVKLEKNSGPLHLTMALKDENGKNMPEKNAVFFTAHYDKSGKLTEVSSPIPVKFMGEGNDAIGYIEREGKIFTLPIDRSKYNQMLQEVKVNKGHSVDLSQIDKEKVQNLNVKKDLKKENERPQELEKPNKGPLNKDMSEKLDETVENLQRVNQNKSKEVESGNTKSHSWVKATPSGMQPKQQSTTIEKDVSSAIDEFAPSKERNATKKLQENNEKLDKILHGVPEDEIPKLILGEAKKGNIEKVSAIVQATSRLRNDIPEGVPVLATTKFNKCYYDGMAIALEASDKKTQVGIQLAVAKIAEKAGADIKPQVHIENVKYNNRQFDQKLNGKQNQSIEKDKSR